MTEKLNKTEARQGGSSNLNRRVLIWSIAAIAVAGAVLLAFGGRDVAELSLRLGTLAPVENGTAIRRGV